MIKQKNMTTNPLHSMTILERLVIDQSASENRLRSSDRRIIKQIPESVGWRDQVPTKRMEEERMRQQSNQGREEDRVAENPGSRRIHGTKR